MRPAFWAILLWLTSLVRAETFTVVVYNVDNLAGIDGRTNSADYRPAQYTRAHLLTKMNNIAKLMQQFNDGQGPEIILFEELERDFSASNYTFDHEGMLRRYADTRIEDMLGSGYDADVAKIPIEGLLLKTFFDRGLTGYRVAAADDAILPDARRYITHLNVVFTRFPVGAVRSYPLPAAPAMEEVQIEVEGYPLYLFNLDWPGDPTELAGERLRIEAARKLRDRLDEILAVNPNADMIVAGDFNCFYDQRLRYSWRRTALYDTLHVCSDPLLLRHSSTYLYNLWNDVPLAQRGSEMFHETWATFMQMLLSRGLYDFRGIQYIDGSFGVGAFDRLNTLPDGRPFPWSFWGIGQGYSDHFPLYARFKTVRNNRTDQFIQLAPKNGELAVPR